MLENQFIQFKQGGNDGCQFPVPFTFGHTGTIAYLENPFNDETINIAATDMEGRNLVIRTLPIDSDDITPFAISNFITKAFAATILKDGQLFRIRYWYSRGNVFESNVLRYVADDAGFSVLKYRCNEDCFGFPFASFGGYASIYLPLRLSNPAYKQEDKTYTKTNGEVVVLFAKYFKEWEGETEYLPEEIHDKIICALSCDEIYIDGVRLAKSDSYEVNWTNAIKQECSDDCILKLAKASFKMSATQNSRNSNY